MVKGYQPENAPENPSPSQASSSLVKEAASKTRLAMMLANDEQYAELLRRMPRNLATDMEPSDFNVLRWWAQALDPTSRDDVTWRNRAAILAAEVMKLRKSFDAQLKHHDAFLDQVVRRLEKMKAEVREHHRERHNG